MTNVQIFFLKKNHFPMSSLGWNPEPVKVMAEVIISLAPPPFFAVPQVAFALCILILFHNCFTYKLLLNVLMSKKVEKGTSGAALKSRPATMTLLFLNFAARCCSVGSIRFLKRT